jgi:hypothetical protein
MLFNTVTQRLYDGKTGFLIIPCAYKRSFIQWGGREGEGGFKGEFSPEEIDQFKTDEKKIKVIDGKLFIPNEDGSVNEKKNDRYEDTRSHFVIVIDPETGEYAPAILSLSSTQIKASKMLMTALQQKKVKTPRGNMTPPVFSNLVRVTTVGKQNDKGSWSGLVFELEGMVTDKELYNDAKEFYKGFVKGDIKADYSKAEQSTDDGSVSDEPQKAEGF